MQRVKFLLLVISGHFFFLQIFLRYVYFEVIESLSYHPEKTMIFRSCKVAEFIGAASCENQIFAYAKTKTQISFAVTVKLIRAFVFTIMDSTIPLLPMYEISSL